MNYFKNAKFFTTVNHLQDLPDTPAEIAFVGRSNAGKSSAINTLTQHTRYAQVPEAIRTHWIQLLGGYLQQRSQLIGLILIMDARHPLKDLDIRMLDFFHTTGRPVHILLSKADKLSKNEQIKTLASVKKSLKPYKERQRISVQLFSSLKKQGIEEVNRIVGEWFEAHAQETENARVSTIPPTP